jgi:hypothetical protein
MVDKHGKVMCNSYNISTNPGSLAGWFKFDPNTEEALVEWGVYTGNQFTYPGMNQIGASLWIRYTYPEYYMSYDRITDSWIWPRIGGNLHDFDDYSLWCRPSQCTTNNALYPGWKDASPYYGQMNLTNVPVLTRCLNAEMNHLNGTVPIDSYQHLCGISENLNDGKGWWLPNSSRNLSPEAYRLTAFANNTRRRTVLLAMIGERGNVFFQEPGLFCGYNERQFWGLFEVDQEWPFNLVQALPLTEFGGNGFSRLGYATCGDYYIGVVGRKIVRFELDLSFKWELTDPVVDRPPNTINWRMLYAR